MEVTGIIYGWQLTMAGRIVGRMQEHANKDFNGKTVHTNKVNSIAMFEGKRYAHTASGSIYILVD